MANSFYINIGAETYTFIPYNYEDIEISFSPDDKVGAWQWLYSITEIIIGGASNPQDYEWLSQRLYADKCRMCYLTYECDGVQYTFKFNYWLCEFDLDRCIISIKCKYYLPNYENFSKNFEEEFDITDHVANSPVDEPHLGITYSYAKKLHDVFDYICGQIGCGWVSTFLTNPFPPMQYLVGSFAPPYAAYEIFDSNPYCNLHLSRSLSSTDAIELSLKQLLDAICNQHLNLRWYFLESTNTLYIEHYKYFNNSLSYSNPPVVGIDATIINAGRWISESNNYKIIEANYYSQERWQMPIKQADVVAVGVHFSFHYRFWYDCSIPSDKIGIVNATFETNLHACHLLGDNQILLMAVDDNGDVYEWPSGLNTIINFPFQSGIIYKYWMWNRPYPYGHRLFIEPEFAMESTIKSREHEVSFPLCCTEVNPYRLVTTYIGNAYIDNWKYKVSSGILSAKLKYEDS